MTQVVSEVVDMMRLWALSDAHTIENVFDRIASETTGNSRRMTSLAICVTLHTISQSIRILSKWAIGCANGLSHFQILIDDSVRVHIGCLCWAIGITLSHE